MGIDKIIIQKFENEEEYTILVEYSNSQIPNVYLRKELKDIISSSLFNEILVDNLTNNK